MALESIISLVGWVGQEKVDVNTLIVINWRQFQTIQVLDNTHCITLGTAHCLAFYY
jgi:hypothetical protein